MTLQIRSRIEYLIQTDNVGYCCCFYTQSLNKHWRVFYRPTIKW